MKPLFDWLDHRVGYRGMARAMLYEHIPGGSRWRYVWGSTLVFAFVVQMVTGFFLWMAYSPSSTTAWESVYYIQHEMTGGWLLRGIHHFMAQMMIVLLALHVAQVVIDGAYRAPREFNFWIGLVLLMVTLGLSLTGYLLPWDQKGYWATKVATNLMVVVPFAGPYLQQIVVGGSEYGHHTLTRFFALHAGLLPLLFIGLTAVHVYLFRRHGIRHKEPKAGPDAYFWVDQVLKDAVACLAVLLVVLFLSARHGILGGGFTETVHLGAELGAPVDPSEAYSAARPEWYFLFLFEFLKLKAFAAEGEVWGAVYIPTLVFLLLALMPLLGQWRIGHRFNIGVMALLLAGILYLTGKAIISDMRDGAYKVAVAQAQKDANRAVELAQAPAGIPLSGAVTLLRNDAYTQGPRLFAQQCATCHRFDGHDGMGKQPPTAQSAPDLKGFASRTWLEGLLDPEKILSAHYFGSNERLKEGDMAEFVTDRVKEYSDEKKATLKKIIAAVSAEGKLKSQRQADAADAAIIEEGRAAIRATTNNCVRCHKWQDAGKEAGPELTGYGSREWLMAFLHNPGHERFYGEENEMPAFGEKKLLEERSIGLIGDWLRGDWYARGDDTADAPPTPTTRPATRPMSETASR